MKGVVTRDIFCKFFETSPDFRKIGKAILILIKKMLVKKWLGAPIKLNLRFFFYQPLKPVGLAFVMSKETVGFRIFGKGREGLRLNLRPGFPAEKILKKKLIRQAVVTKD